nr:YciI family protein [Planosporangium flavigriseum]
MLIVTYTAPQAEVEAVLATHLAWVADHYDDGTFLVSGRQNPRTGGFIIAKGDDRAAIERMVATDPFVTEGVATYTVLQVEPTRAAAEWRTALADAGVQLPN